MNGIDKINAIIAEESLRKNFRDNGIRHSDLQISVFAVIQTRIANEVLYQVNNRGETFGDELCYLSTVKVLKEIIKEYRLQGEWERYGAVHFYMGIIGLGGSI